MQKPCFALYPRRRALSGRAGASRAPRRGAGGTPTRARAGGSGAHRSASSSRAPRRICRLLMTDGARRMTAMREDALGQSRGRRTAAVRTGGRRVRDRARAARSGEVGVRDTTRASRACARWLATVASARARRGPAARGLGKSSRSAGEKSAGQSRCRSRDAGRRATRATRDVGRRLAASRSRGEGGIVTHPWC